MTKYSVRFRCKKCGFRFRKQKSKCNYSIIIKKYFTKCPECNNVCKGEVI